MGFDDIGTVRFPGHVYKQVVVKPDELRAGPSAPWSDCPQDVLRPTLATVIARVGAAQRGLGDQPIAAEMDTLVLFANDAPLRQSAVLLVLSEEDGDATIVFTRRATHLRNHAGEVSFPGGRANDGEAPLTTALRETYEEVGIDASGLEPVGMLHPLITYASNSAIWPVVAAQAIETPLVIDASEVDAAYRVRLRDLLEPGAFHCEEWRRSPKRANAEDEGFFPMYFYRVPGDLIWGATARILTELLCLVTGTVWADEARIWG